MKTAEALKLYNWAENIVKKSHPSISAVKRAEEINKLLSLQFGENESDEIIELVFEHEFYPIGLNKNE